MWIQSKDYLKWSRRILLPQKEKKHIADILELKENFKVLDVGCGNGELINYLNDVIECQYFGIDLDEELINFAKADSKRNMEYAVANAEKLPFEDSSFDIIISHTFLTAIFNVERAFDEMIRVCKPNGYIVSLSSESFNNSPYNEGFYENENWIGEYLELKRELDYRYLKKANMYSKGIKPEYIPRFFSKKGLKNVSVTPIGRFFSLSDSSLNIDELNNYVEMEYKAELSRSYLLPLELSKRYEKLLNLKKEKMKKNTNDVWNWYGGETIIVKGLNNKKSSEPNKLLEYLKIKDYFISNKVNVIEQGIRSDLDSIASVKLQQNETNNIVSCCAETPTMALNKAYCKLFAKYVVNKEAENFIDNETLLSNNEFLKNFLKKVCNDVNYNYFNENKKLSVSKFKNLKNDKVIYIPNFILESCYSGLGISYGCSRDEAIQNSLYDIYAIYSIKQMISNNIKIDGLNIKSIKQIDEIKNILNILEGMGYKFNFYNISEDNNISVILVLTTKNGLSKINFKCNSNIIIAIKEVLFDLINERKIDNLLSHNATIKKCCDFNLNDIHNLIENGNGIIPECLLSIREKNYKNINLNSTNQEIDMLNLFNKNNWDLYVKEYNYDEEVIIQLITPYICKFELTNEMIMDYKLSENMKDILQKFYVADNANKARVLKYISISESKFGKNNNLYFAQLLENKYLFGVKIDLKILNMLYFISVNEYKEALKYITIYNEKFRCLKDFLIVNNISYLQHLYSNIMVEEVKELIDFPFKCLDNGENEL